MNPLQSRLAQLRRRLRLVVSLRGGCLALAVLVGSVALACLLDATVYLRMSRDLPSLIRALFLAGIVGGSGYIAYRFLLRPLRAPADDLALALRVEEQYPILNDALASTVQFLQEGDAAPGVSATLQREAVQRAMRLAQGCDFNKVVDRRGTRLAFAWLGGAAGIVVLLLFWQSGLALSALARVADPFGGHRWPGQGQQTFLEVSYPQRIGFGHRFVIQAKVSGFIPDRAVIEFQDLSPSPQQFTLEQNKEGPGATLNAPIDLVQQRRDFRFRVRANDAVSPPEGWHSVALRHPPSLAPLGDKPSPQLEIIYPRYTGLPSPLRLPAGSGNIEGVDGTHVRIRGATDRPIAHVWIEQKPVVEGALLSSVFASLGASHFAETLALTVGGQAVWGRTYGTIQPDGRAFAIDYTPRVKGAYLLVVEDSEGLSRPYEFDQRVVADPLPLVSFLRPSGHQSVLPNAEITIHARAEDEVYGVRDLYLEVRRKGTDGKFHNGELLHLSLYDPEAFGTVIPQVMSTFAVSMQPRPSILPATAVVPLKLTRAEGQRRWSLAGLSLREGDVLAIQACARDFNDVPAFPVPGRSPVLELRVVNHTTLITELDDIQAQLERELLRLREMEDKAIRKVVAAEEHWRATGKLRAEDMAELAEAEQIQKQIQARVGEKSTEGIRAELRRMEQVMKDNKLPQSATSERLKAMKEELERLAREHLPEIEPRLMEARRALEDPKDAQPPPPQAKNELSQAREHQEEVRRSIDDLLRFLENWADNQQVRGELRQILQEQRDLQKDTQKLEQNSQKWEPKQPLPPEDEATLRRVASLQKLLGEKTGQLIDKMKRMAEEKVVQDERSAEMLRKAAEIGDEAKLPGEIKDSGEQLHDPKTPGRQPQLNRALTNQEESIKTLERMVEAMEQGRDADLERLVRKQKNERKNLDELGERLEKLRKKVEQARNLADPKEREATLKKLAEEQRKLQEEAEQQARELRRLQAPQAGKALEQAGDKMEGAVQKMDRGEPPDEDLKEAQEKIAEAQEQLRQAQERAEEELAREQMARIADRLKGLKERQDAAIVESERLHKAMLQRSRWERELLGSLSDHGDNQELLAKETASLQEKLKGALVFEHMLNRSVASMEDAAKRILARKQEALRRPLGKDGAEPLGKAALTEEEKAQKETLRLQNDASKRLERMMEAIKPEPNVAQKPKQKKDNKAAQAKKGDPKEKEVKGAQPSPGDNVPPLAQLKALRAEQQDVHERTADFAQRHPNVEVLPPDAQGELNGIQQDQERLSELFRKMQQAAGGDGGNP